MRIHRRTQLDPDGQTLIEGLPRPLDYTYFPEQSLSDLLEWIEDRIDAHEEAGSIDWATPRVLDDVINARMDDMREQAFVQRMEHERQQERQLSVTYAELAARRVQLEHARAHVAWLEQLANDAYREITGAPVPAGDPGEQEIPNPFGGENR